MRLDYGQPVSHNEVRISPSGTLSFLLDGKATRPVAAYLETTYERIGKDPKVVHRTPLDPAAPGVNPNLVLERFDFLLAVDTNTTPIHGGSVSVACVVKCDYVDLGQKALAQWEPRQVIELRNVVGAAENVAWQVVIESITANPRFAAIASAGIIVDSDLGHIPNYNARSLPICGDFFLPPKFELLYASSDTGSEFVANRMIARADQVSRAILRQIIAGKVGDEGLRRAEDVPFTHYRTWLPSAGPDQRPGSRPVT